MVSEKDFLIELLEKALSISTNDNLRKKAISFDNSEYKTFLTNFTAPGDIINITDAMLERLANNIEPKEKQNSFEANIKFLKGLAEVNPDVKFNQKQLIQIEELKELIRRTINNNNVIIATLADKKENYKNKYQTLLDLIKSDELIEAKTYDLVEEVVRKTCPINTEITLDKIVTYLNSRNAEKLEKLYNTEAPATSKEMELELPKTKDESLVVLEAKLASFIQRCRSMLKKKDTLSIEKDQIIKDLIAHLGLNYDSLNEYMKIKLTTIQNIKEFESFIYYLKDKNPIILQKLKTNNLVGLICILTESNQTIVEKVLHNLTYINNIEEDNLIKIVNLLTSIFGKEGHENYLANSILFQKYDADINMIIDQSITLLTVDNKKLKDTIKQLENHQANIKSIFEKCAIALSSDYDLIMKNLDILKVYGFNLTSFFAENDACYVLLNCQELTTKLDQLIEVGLNEYIHKSLENAGNTLRTLIVKRVFYSFKNNLPVWISKDEYDTYNEYLENSNYVISDSDISLLIAEHPVLEIFDEGCRPAIYSATPLALLKRKTELLFGNKIISRLKAYRIFKLLVDKGVNDKKALMYAFPYKTNLDNLEFDLIKSRVENSGVE